MNNNVVITGMGVISSLGLEVNELWQNLLDGKSGINTINSFDTTELPVKISAQIQNFDPLTIFDNPKEIRRTSKFMQYQLHCAYKAIEQSGIDVEIIDKKRAGVIIGSGIGGLEVYEENMKGYLKSGIKRISPFVIPLFITNQGPGEVARKTGFMGPNFSVSSACSSANHAIISAYDQIKLNRADVMLAGGAEAPIGFLTIAAFSNARALSRRNNQPQKASRPFDIDRDGFIIGEGGAVFVLERESHARARGAKILARILGGGMSSDASHITSPREDGSGIRLAISEALQEANIKTIDVDYINAHATSTVSGDIAECKSIRDIFGSHTDSLKVSATKSMLGHALGGASALELAVCIKTLETGKIHPTINVENQDPLCDVDCVPNKFIEHKTNISISNSFGFGGHNTCVVLAKP